MLGNSAQVQDRDDLSLERESREVSTQEEHCMLEVDAGAQQLGLETVRNLGVYLSPEISRGDDSDSSVPELEECPQHLSHESEVAFTQR